MINRMRVPGMSVIFHIIIYKNPFLRRRVVFVKNVHIAILYCRITMVYIFYETVSSVIDPLSQPLPDTYTNKC